MKFVPFVTLISVLAASSPAGASDNWPQFRGPDSAGVGASVHLPSQWSPTENVAWKRAVPGRSWSSPIVWGGKVFVTAVVNPGDSEAPKKGLYFGGERPAPATEQESKLLCMDLSTSKILWERTLHRGRPQTSKHLKNSYGAETPVTDGERVYAVFGGLGVYALTLDGKEVWSKPLEPRKTRFGWGYASSPALAQGKLFLVNDNEERSELLALDAKTGAQLWRVDRDEKTNWATPFIWSSGKRAELITCGTRAVRSYDLDGKLLWSLRGMSSIAIPTPFAGGGLLYVSSGYVGDRLRPIYAIRPGASGDITLKPEETSSEFIAWPNPTAGPYNPSPLYYQGRIYVLYDRGLISCFDAVNGKPLYEKERLPQGSGFTSSPWAAVGKVFCLNEDGVCYVLRAGDRFDLLHTNRLGEDEMCMATPALAGDRLLIRTATGLTCVRDGGGKSGKVAR